MAVTFPQQWADRFEHDEAEQVRRWRFQTARRAGLSREEAGKFADGDGDTATLRDASERGATREQLVLIFL